MLLTSIIRGIAPDLPREGNHHTDSAEDQVAMHLYDNHRTSHPKANFRAIARHVVRQYGDDRKESKANDRKADRKYQASLKPKKEPKVKVPEPYWKKAGYSSPISKGKPGIGSYGKVK